MEIYGKRRQKLIKSSTFLSVLILTSIYKLFCHSEEIFKKAYITNLLGFIDLGRQYPKLTYPLTHIYLIYIFLVPLMHIVSFGCIRNTYVVPNKPPPERFPPASFTCHEGREIYFYFTPQCMETLLFLSLHYPRNSFQLQEISRDEC